MQTPASSRPIDQKPIVIWLSALTALVDGANFDIVARRRVRNAADYILIGRISRLHRYVAGQRGKRVFSVVHNA